MEQTFTYHQKKDTKLLMIQNCFKHSIRMKYQKITNLLDATSDKAPRFITKNGQKFMISLEDHTILTNK